MIGRSRDVATPAERGDDCRLDRDAVEVPPNDRRHDLETLADHDGPPVERCRHCERARSVGTIDPFGACPARRDDREGDGGSEPTPAPRVETEG